MCLSCAYNEVQGQRGEPVLKNPVYALKHSPVADTHTHQVACGNARRFVSNAIIIFFFGGQRLVNAL